MRDARPARIHPFRIVTKAALLAGIWLVFSGHYDAFHLALGAVSVAAVMVFNIAVWRMPPERGGPAERERLQFVPALLYAPWLLLQIVTSAVYVTRLILGPIENVKPRIFAFRSDQPNEVAAVTLGNSITLTPGTLTLDIEDDVYWIHALDARSEEGVLDGEMQRRVASIWGGKGETSTYAEPEPEDA